MRKEFVRLDRALANAHHRANNDALQLLMHGRVQEQLFHASAEVSARVCIATSVRVREAVLCAYVLECVGLLSGLGELGGMVVECALGWSFPHKRLRKNAHRASRLLPLLLWLMI